MWHELQQLGPLTRQQPIWQDAYATARATMQRVRVNVEVIYARLNALGYRFLRPKYAFLRPAPDASQVLEVIEGDIGPLPLSLRAFYEVVGEVDFRQSEEQLIKWTHPRREVASEIELLGEEDPLVVASLKKLGMEVKEIPTKAARLYFCFAPDEFHKAGYSGGENYHVWLPDSSADFRVVGMYGIDEFFVDYLRETLWWGGFRGKCETLPEDEMRCLKKPPALKVVHMLSKELDAI